jgi:hypothetical protein
MRLLAGIVLGVGQPRMVAMVFDELDERLTLPTSASVPVFTDQRSTPQLWASRSGGAREAASRKTHARITRRTLLLIVPPRLKQKINK